MVPHNAAPVPKHANMTKESTRTLFCVSQDTAKNVKSKHFAKDILKKSKAHRCHFQDRKNKQKLSLKPSRRTPQELPSSSARPPTDHHNGNRYWSTKIKRRPAIPHRGQLQFWPKSACWVIYIYIYLYILYIPLGTLLIGSPREP